MKSPARLLLIFTALVLATACERKDHAGRGDPPPNDVLARVGDEVITSGQFLTEAKLRRAHLEPDGARALLDELVREARLLHHAKEKKLNQTPEFQSMMRRALITKAQEDMGLTSIDEASVPTEEDLQRFYNEHAELFKVPERIRIAVIHIKVAPQAPDEAKAHCRARMEEALAAAQEAGSNADQWAQVVAKYSEDQATRYAGGDFGYIIKGATEDVLSPTVLAAAFALASPGDISPIIEAPDGLWLLKLAERTDASVLPFKVAQPRVAAQWRSAQAGGRAKTVEARLAEIPAETFLEKLASLELPHSSSPTPPTMSPTPTAGAQ